jgi:hypothetical protein
MTVWVDELVDYGWRLGPSCHLLADTRDELHDFAGRLGLRRSWFQDKPRLWHYDLTAGRRVAAVALGAIEMDRRASVLRAGKRDGDNQSVPSRDLPDDGVADVDAGTIDDAGLSDVLSSVDEHEGPLTDTQMDILREFFAADAANDRDLRALLAQYRFEPSVIASLLGALHADDDLRGHIAIIASLRSDDRLPSADQAWEKLRLDIVNATDVGRAIGLIERNRRSIERAIRAPLEAQLEQREEQITRQAFASGELSVAFSAVRREMAGSSDDLPTATPAWAGGVWRQSAAWRPISARDANGSMTEGGAIT